MATIHPTAIIEGDCECADDVEIGPQCVVTGPVKLGAGVRLVGRSHIQGPVAIGERCMIYPGACIGFPPQDVKFKLGDPTAGVRVGDDTIIRELVTIHASTSAQTPTIVGNNVFMMVQSHVGHDARVDDHCVLVNSAAVGGHSHLGERVTLGGNSGIHQNTRIGKLVFVTGVVGMSTDVPPFAMISERNLMTGINVVGMRRAGYSTEEISGVRLAFREALRTNMPTPDRLALLREHAETCPPVNEIIEFIEQRGTRGMAHGVGQPSRTLAYWLQRVREGAPIPGDVDDD